MLILLYFTFAVGGLAAVTLFILKKVKHGDNVPLVPFLFLGTLCAILFGDIILQMEMWGAFIS